MCQSKLQELNRCKAKRKGPRKQRTTGEGAEIKRAQAPIHYKYNRLLLKRKTLNYVAFSNCHCVSQLNSLMPISANKTTQPVADANRTSNIIAAHNPIELVTILIHSFET